MVERPIFIHDRQVEPLFKLEGNVLTDLRTDLRGSWFLVFEKWRHNHCNPLPTANLLLQLEVFGWTSLVQMADHDGHGTSFWPDMPSTNGNTWDKFLAGHP